MFATQTSFWIFLLIFSANLQAGVLSTSNRYYPADFYSAVDQGLRDQPLKDQLFKILSQAHVPGPDHDTLQEHCQSGDKGCYQQEVLGYNRAREILFGEIHLAKTPDGFGVLDVYCQQMETSKDFRDHPPGPGQIPNSNVLNTEHTWPQSRFSKAFSLDMQKSDLHILYPVLEKANSSRSNLEYGDVTTVSDQPCAQSKRGLTAQGGAPVFEPPNVHKGNAARAVLYFSVRYKLPISPAEEASLKAWNHQDPVDDFERQRNEQIFAKQHERNPFIDHPELADLISDF